VVIMIQLSVFQTAERHLHLHMQDACSRHEQAECTSSVVSDPSNHLNAAAMQELASTHFTWRLWLWFLPFCTASADDAGAESRPRPLCPPHLT
jgi:hypothetical protein